MNNFVHDLPMRNFTSIPSNRWWRINSDTVKFLTRGESGMVGIYLLNRPR